ncbi:hypothetical protein M514_06666 [Trichuris suis]|uniref:SH2 domain-containing protein n=1 Tax=Trichuris suis TaxID=68888 RepID=A0A085NHQ3_9BILA
MYTPEWQDPVPRQKNGKQCPWTKLPFFHGQATLAAVTEQLKSEGDFLLFANSAALCAPTLAVHGSSFNVTTFPLQQGEGDYFYIKQADLAMKCTTIGALINFYVNCKIRVKMANGDWTLLKFPIENKAIDEHLLLEPTDEIEEWTYYHGSYLDPDTRESLLHRNGDYLLTGLPKESSTLTFYVMWADSIHEVNFEQDGPLGSYQLRCDHYYTPKETVPTLDYLVKSLARSQATASGYQFIRPVKRNAFDMNDYDVTKKRRLAPLPLHLLPYYHGKLSGRIASTMTTNAGDYLVYKTESDQLKLVVKQVGKREKFYYHYHIRKDNNNHFFIRLNDKKKRFGTVHELIEYYEEEKVALNGNKDCTGKTHKVTLVNPVNRESDPIAEELYDHGEIDRDVSFFRLTRDGDFLIRTIPCTDLKVVSVRWHDDVLDLQLNEGDSEKYFLPKYEDTESAEWVSTLQEFLEIVVASNLQLGNVCLKRAIGRE